MPIGGQISGIAWTGPASPSDFPVLIDYVPLGTIDQLILCDNNIRKGAQDSLCSLPYVAISKDSSLSATQITGEFVTLLVQICRIPIISLNSFLSLAICRP